MAQEKNRVVITGIGSILPNAYSVEEFWNKIKEGDSQIDFIKSEVDKDVIGDFQYVWQQSKLYFIGTGIFLLILFILIVCLLFYKASK